jgi:transcriptional regulator with XRE-family HTH domain
METGLLIKELRIKKGLTQEELADKTELSARTIQRIENGEVDPRAYSLQMIAKALDVDFSLFVEDESTEDKEKKVKEDRFLLGLVHLSGLLPLFIPTILIWKNLKYKVEGITNHFYEVISFQLTILLVFIIPGLLIYYFLEMQNFINKPYLIYLGIILGVAISIHNTINVINNKPYTRFNIFTSKKKDKKDTK